MHSKKNYNNKSAFPIQGLRPMSKSLPNGLKTILKKCGYNYASIINNWSDLVGKQISDVCYPKSIKTGKELKDGILHLNVFHGDQLLIEYNKSKIIVRINVFFGYKFVKNIKIFLIKEKIDPKKNINFTNNKNSKYQKKLEKIQNPELKKKINNLINAFNNKK